MNVWCHLPTIISRRNILRIAGFLAICVAITTTFLFASLTHAAAGVNQTLSFQGRLLSSSGAVVADGFYNIQFKIYQDGDGTAAGDTGGTGGALKWTETYVNNGGTAGVEVKDGFFSVELGSLNPFGTSVDWNQDTLWLSMNVAGSSASCTTFGTAPCTADGEMLPMKRITSAPYALNSGMLGGITSAGYLQNTTTPQTADFNITGAGTASTLQGTTSVNSPLFDTASAGPLSIGTVNATTIDIGTNNSAHTIAIGTGTGAQAVTLGSTSGTSQTTIQGGSTGIQLSSTGGVSTASGTALTANGTATFNQGISIQGTGTSGYGIDATSDINSSTAYRINGSTALNNTSLNFGGTSTSTITSASAQSLTINGSAGVTIQDNGANSATFSATNVQIGTGSGTGTPTTLTLDKASTAPSGVVGSMYYDTTLGEVQCYEASGWGNCSAAPDHFVSLSPTYANAVVHPTGTGTLTNDFCSDSLNINNGTSSQPAVCGTNETYNYYDWTSAQTTAQTRSIYVTYQLPTSFKNFVAGSTSLMGRTDSTDGTVSYQVYKNTATGLTACGSAVATSTGVQTTWQKGTAASTADPASCSFAAGDSIVFKVDLASANNANAYASTLNFAYSNN